MYIYDVRCNGIICPLGINTPRPMFSFKLHSNVANFQTAYRILVSDSAHKFASDTGNIWDSGKIQSKNSAYIEYDGANLISNEKYFYKICIWDENDKVSDWSSVSYWITGIIPPDQWHGKWIASPSHNNKEGYDFAPLFRKSFFLNKAIDKMIVNISGLGYFELYVNGQKISDDILNPAFTAYDKTVLYCTYDVKDYIKIGENVFSVMLGNGFYNSGVDDVWGFKDTTWKHNPKFILYATGVYNDGETFILNTDKTWKTQSGAIFYNELRNGEYYDARLEKHGFKNIGFDDFDLTYSILASPPGGVLRPQLMPTIKVIKEIKPICFWKTENNSVVFDFGQNISGFAKINVCGRAGDELIIKYGEVLDDNKCISQTNIKKFVKSGEFQTDKYILKGGNNEVWHPHFTYHGFRYAQLFGYNNEITTNTMVALVVHTDLEKTGNFSCSNELINKIQHCTIWSTLTNFHGFVEDCPQREKNGWTGDAHLSAEQALYNFNIKEAYRKWLGDFRDAQRPSGQLPVIIPTSGWGYNGISGPAWDSAALLIPYYIYLYTGDISILRENYQMMKKYVDYLFFIAEDFVIEQGLGDWSSPEGGWNYKCPTVVTNTAYFYYDCKILSEISKTLGFMDNYNKYSNLSKQIKNTFRCKYINFETTTVYGDCITSYACALYHDLINKSEKPIFAQKLNDLVKKSNYNVDFGILGAKYIFDALSDNGYLETAYKIATQTTYPSWGFWIENGATTLYETWNGNSSRNHHMFSEISKWFYKYLAGINYCLDNPGFKHIIIKPFMPKELKWVNASFITIYGEVKINWIRISDKLELNITIPTNCTADIYIGTKMYSVKSGNSHFTN